VERRILVRVGDGIAATTVAPTPNLSSSSAQTTVAPSDSSLTTSLPSTDTLWQNAAVLFSALSYAETASWSSGNRIITNWLLIDNHQTLPAIYERANPSAWLDHAKCRGLPGNLFYAEYQHNNSQVQEARSVCRGTHPDHPGVCPVIQECLDYAISNGERYGVWGGCSERERRRIKRQRHRDALQEAPGTTPGDRPELESVIRHDQAGNPTPWRCSKALIAAWRAERAGLGPAPIGDQPLRLVPQGELLPAGRSPSQL
jgi:WhiB family redox-sensing transcriptional regulator